MFFQNSVIKKYLAALNAEQVTAAWEVYKAYFLNKEIQDNIRSSKEEQFQEGFLRELFVKVFGYTLTPPTSNPSSLRACNRAKNIKIVLRGDFFISLLRMSKFFTTFAAAKVSEQQYEKRIEKQHLL